jgi:hypothetical protein
MAENVELSHSRIVEEMVWSEIEGIINPILLLMEV